MKLVRSKVQSHDGLENSGRHRNYSFVTVPRPFLTLNSESKYLANNKIESIKSRNTKIDDSTTRSSYQIKEIRLNSLSAIFIKRFSDIAGSLIGLVLVFPFWIITSILIKIDTPGPIFYTQTRVGQDRRKSRRREIFQPESNESRHRERRRENSYGETFQVIKFRTMVNYAERDSGPVWASQNDSRITGVGAVLRKLRFDETPQFMNVLLGDMSLVGPRPERPEFVREFIDNIDGYGLRLQVKPGLTGLAQIRGSYDSSPATVARKLKDDLEYINNWSLWLDIKILFRTIIVVLTGKGAH